MLPIDVDQQPQIIQQIKTEPEVIIVKNNNSLPDLRSSTVSNRFFLEPIVTPPPLIDTSTPESLERDFHAWMKVDSKWRGTPF